MRNAQRTEIREASSSAGILNWLTGYPAQGPERKFLEGRIGPSFLIVTQASAEEPAFAVFVDPDHGMLLIASVDAAEVV